jgi:hypothetical protein
MFEILIDLLPDLLIGHPRLHPKGTAPKPSVIDDSNNTLVDGVKHKVYRREAILVERIPDVRRDKILLRP